MKNHIDNPQRDLSNLQTQILMDLFISINSEPKYIVSADQFESRIKGRTYNSMSGLNTDKYVRGCILVDYVSSYVHVEHQIEFSGSETIRAKQNLKN